MHPPNRKSTPTFDFDLLQKLVSSDSFGLTQKKCYNYIMAHKNFQFQSEAKAWAKQVIQTKLLKKHFDHSLEQENKNWADVYFLDYENVNWYIKFEVKNSWIYFISFHW